jgi:DNA adenine methylase
MTRTLAKLRPAVKWHGGKAYLAREIVRRMPAHTSYVEPFAGGLSVLLNKPRSAREVVGDLNGDLIGFYRCLQDRERDLLERLGAISYTPQSFAWSLEPGTNDDLITAAARFIVKHRFSRGGLGKTFAWSKRLRGGQPGDKNAWETIRDHLPRIAERLEGVEIHQAPALELIRRHDGPETLFYLDPPYLPESRTARKIYAHEMSRQDHSALLECIAGIRGMVILSGYRSSLYDHALASWERHEIEKPNNAGQGKTKERRTEVLWLSPGCERFVLS